MRTEHSTSMYRVVAVAALLRSGVRDNGRPEIFVVGKLETLRHHAHNDGRLFIQAHGAANHCRILGVTAVPDSVADEDCLFRAGHFIGCNEAAARDRVRPQHVEHPRRDAHSPKTVGGISTLAQRRGKSAERFQVFEGVGRLSNVAEFRVETETVSRLADGFAALTITSRSPPRNGKGLYRTAFTRLKTVVLTPIPSASVAAIAAENQGLLPIMRNANRTSCPQVINRLRAGCERSCGQNS